MTWGNSLLHAPFLFLNVLWSCRALPALSCPAIILSRLPHKALGLAECWAWRSGAQSGRNLRDLQRGSRWPSSLESVSGAELKSRLDPSFLSQAIDRARLESGYHCRIVARKGLSCPLSFFSEFAWGCLDRCLCGR